MVQKRTCASANRTNKGVRQAGFLVLRETSMPSCLIELGFITTFSEEQYLNTKQGVDALGYGIYQAFVDYRNKFDKSITVPFRIGERMIEPQQSPQELVKDNTEQMPKQQGDETTGKEEQKESTADTRQNDGKIYKYTVGCSENYNEIYRLRKTILHKFPQAFIIAFKNGERTDVVEAIREYKRNKSNKGK